jgi:hypothetical protein
MKMLLPEKDQPQKACEKKNDAGIEEGERANVVFKLEANQRSARRERERKCDCQAEHPDGKKRADDVDVGRVAAAGEQQAG